MVEELTSLFGCEPQILEVEFTQLSTGAQAGEEKWWLFAGDNYQLKRGGNMVEQIRNCGLNSLLGDDVIVIQHKYHNLTAFHLIDEVGEDRIELALSRRRA